MPNWNRRNLLTTMVLAAVGQAAVPSAFAVQAKREPGRTRVAAKPKLALEDYEPKSMLHVPETKVPRARFAAIDFHTHLSWSGRRGRVTEAHDNATVEE